MARVSAKKQREISTYVKLVIDRKVLDIAQYDDIIFEFVKSLYINVYDVAISYDIRGGW